MKVPKAINNMIESFQSLPGIGPKTAQRLTFHLLHYPQEHLERIANTFVKLKQATKLCSICKNVGEEDICAICGDSTRNQNLILVVSSPLDAFAIERTGFKGVYHVLHGLLDPLNNIGPEELFINDLVKRLNARSQDYFLDIEVILATNMSMEGEATAMYLSKLIRDSGLSSDKLKITRIARGLPVGGDIEYADEVTLSRALDGRGTF